jgi:2-methylcitrate dehydratase PrpD
MVLDGDVTTGTYEPASIGRAEVEALARRVRWTVTGDGPAADAAGAARVSLVDGRTVNGAVKRSAGGPDNPLSDAQLEAKFLGNAGPSGAEVIPLVRGIADLDSLAPLLAAVSRMRAAS